ncbi:NAD(P)/FAD-dependent oxidoreductase [Egbenema bharatensis]|uniref:NAD(P)/FAD-dependent oxidoreductase n=1 Tax=Egbenema bharatensis TaxID=3463334 RepID=UPI003A865591
MPHIIIIGCGIIGASIAYELSREPQFQVTVLDRQPPAQEATGAALGVLMGIISQKLKGRAWAMRQSSMQRYGTLIPELEGMTGQKIPWNRQGILKLLFEADDRAKWQRLAEIRQSQGWQLELWDCEQVRSHCPQIQNPRVTGAVYSPDDRQVNPTALTQALVTAAQRNGVTFRFDAQVTRFASHSNPMGQFPGVQMQLANETLSADWVIVAAGLGSTELTQTMEHPIALQPVLGQAMRVKLPEPMGDRTFQPVITGEDIHVVPLGQAEYWVGATVEFPAESNQATLEAMKQEAMKTDRLETVWQGAIALCPELAQATLLSTWSGVRPRPHNRPAPIVEPMTGYANVLLATGHYRNGVLLAPATAQMVRSMLLSASS